MEMIWVWLAVVAVSLIVEFFTWDLTSIWFAVAGLVSLILSAIDGINWVWQLGVFIVISALLIIFVRQICRKLLLKSDEKTNVDAFVGKKTTLLTGIVDANNMGTVKFNGVTWNAITENGVKLNEGTAVEVVRVDGNKMIVKETNSIEDTSDNDLKKNNEEKVISSANQKSSKNDKKSDEKVKEQEQVASKKELEDENK